MESYINTQHPYIQHQQQGTIAKQGVVVIDNVTCSPVYEDSYIVPELLIVIAHQGMLLSTDVMPNPVFGAHDVGVLLPDQMFIAVQASDDYQSTLIAVSRKFYSRLLHTYSYTRYAPCYRRNPATHLTGEQYNSLLNAIGLLRTLTQSESPHRVEMLSNLLAIILNMIGEWHVSNHPGDYKLSPSEMLFNRFYDALIRHHCESREVAFYAHLCSLSPKHFSEVIKRETGIGAAEWISNYVTTRAKLLLGSRKEMNIQQISLQLGFTEQASFTRFFKNQTGLTPSEFRESSQ